MNPHAAGVPAPLANPSAPGAVAAAVTSPAQATSQQPPTPPPPRRRPWRGALVLALVLALIGAGLWHLLARSRDARGKAAQAPALVTVGHALVRKAQLPVVLDALGTVAAASTVTLRPQVSGLLAQVLFAEGQMVRKGQLLAQIDARPYEQALLQAQGERQRDAAQLDEARLTLARYRTLLAQDSIARQEVDNQSALVRQLEGTLLAAAAGEERARLDLEATRITAPAAGRIGLRALDAGNLVSAGAAGGGTAAAGGAGGAGGAGIATIVQIAPIDVQFSVAQDSIAQIRAAQRGQAVLTVTALDRTRATVLDQGRFVTLDNQVDSATGTVRAKARFANAAGALFPNQFVNVQLLLRTVSALVVPVTALRTGPNGDYVYVIDASQRVQLRPVQRALASGALVAIAAGLAEGERVVTEGGDRLQHGMAVQLPGESAAHGGGRGGHGAGTGRAAAPGQRAAQR